MSEFVSTTPNSVRVSYNSRFDKDGTHYNQMLSVVLADKQLKAYNTMVNDTLLSNGVREYTKMHLRQLKFGDNYTGLTTLDYFIRFFDPLKSNKRIQMARNTIIRIKEG